MLPSPVTGLRFQLFRMMKKSRSKSLMIFGLTVMVCLWWFARDHPCRLPGAEVWSEAHDILKKHYPQRILTYGKSESGHNNRNKNKVVDHSLPQRNYSYPNNKERETQLQMRFGTFTSCSRQLSFEGPFDYLPESRNPCWQDGSVLRCIPIFHMPGFGKSGTTDIFYKLKAHPQVTYDAKEIHWLDHFRYKNGYGSVESYSMAFQGATKKIDEEIRKNGFSNLIIAEATPAYIADSFHWKCYEDNTNSDQPIFTNADYIYHLYPKTKIIVTLREPVTRLYSSFLFSVPLRKPWAEFYGGKGTPENFHKAVVLAIGLYKKCFQQWSVRSCAYNGTLFDQVRLNLVEGLYSVYLKDWLKVFPREQIHFVIHEDYVKHTRVAVEKIYAFLDLYPLSNATMNNLIDQPAVNKGTGYGVGPMWNETRQLLTEFYLPFVKELSSLVGYKGLRDQLQLWGY